MDTTENNAGCLKYYAQIFLYILTYVVKKVSAK